MQGISALKGKIFPEISDNVHLSLSSSLTILLFLSMSTANEKGLRQIGKHFTKDDRFVLLYNSTDLWKGMVEFNQ